MLKEPTVDELLETARKERPNVAYTKSKDGKAIAAWSQGRWICVASLCVDGVWRSVEFEVMANGEPVWNPDEWIDVEMTEEQRLHGMSLALRARS